MGAFGFVLDVVRVRGFASSYGFFLHMLFEPLLGEGLLARVPPAPSKPCLLCSPSGNDEAHLPPIWMPVPLSGQPFEHAVRSAGRDHPRLWPAPVPAKQEPDGKPRIPVRGKAEQLCSEAGSFA